MDFRYKPAIRIISLVTLLFFCWTFGGMVDIAYAIKNSDQQSAISNQQKENNQKSSQGSRPNKQKPEEKFQKTIEDIEKTLTDTTSDTDTKKNKLKAKKVEIESLDIEIKKQFAATEKYLKEKGLPPEILDRHRKFVRHYEDNLKELNDNLAAIEKSKKKSDADAAISRAKAHLEKVKAPSKHVPLDPNKLPHRTAEPVWIEPRTSPEEFKTEDRAQNQEHRQKPILEARQIPTFVKGGEGGLSNNNPILVASAGSLNGLLNSPIPDTQYPPHVLLALADPPTSADLAETIEVKFTPAIQAKATELNHNPVKIYNWVRNNIEFVPTYGSIQGADMCLQTKLCNDTDTASLLIALLRVSGIHARYVQGTIELPIEKVKNWVGGFTDSMEALRLLASARIPVKGMTVGGEIKYVRIEHVYVDAWIDYIPSRGARHKVGDMWIPLDASFKQYAYTQGIDIRSVVPFDAQSFIDQIQSTATINEAEGYVTNVNSTYIQQTMTDYQTQVQNYITQNYPNATVGDVLGKKDIIKQEFPILAGTLPYKTIVKGTTYASIPDSLRHKINFNVIKDNYDEIIGTPINITKSLPELAGKKITLSYSPATPQDEAVINSFLPKPHADGTPIDPSELPSSLPAYLINLKPELRIDGVVIAIGTTVGLGTDESLRLTFSAPNKSHEQVSHLIKGGEYVGIGIDHGNISKEQMLKLKTKLETTKAKIEAQDFTNLTKDDLLGDLLYTTALSYYVELDMVNNIQSKTMGIECIRLPSEAAFYLGLNATYVFEIPHLVSAGGLVMDVARNINSVKSKDGDNNKKFQFMTISGINSSALEQSMLEQLFSTTDNAAQGISAVKALQIANDQGIPIYTINQTNMNTMLPELQVDADVKVDIQNAVNSGKVVIVSKTNIISNGWIGCGYIIFDPVTGNGAYMINGGIGGGLILVTALLLLAITAAICIGSAGAGCVALTLLLPFYISFQAWLATVASEQTRNCVKAIVISLGLILLQVPQITLNPLSIVRLTVTIYGSINRISRDCFGVGVVH